MNVKHNKTFSDKQKQEQKKIKASLTIVNSVKNYLAKKKMNGLKQNKPKPALNVQIISYKKKVGRPRKISEQKEKENKKKLDFLVEHQKNK